MKQRKVGRLLLQVLFTMVLVCGACTVPAFATVSSETPLESLNRYVREAKEGETVKLPGNITGTLEINTNVSFILDLDGKTLDGGNGTAIEHNGTGTLTITDGASGGAVTNATNDGIAIQSAGGTVNVSSGTVTATGTGWNAAAISSTGTVNVTGGTVQATGTAPGTGTGTGDAIDAKTVNISQANPSIPTTVTATNRAISATGIVEVTGGTVSCSGSNYVIHNTSGTVNVSGGTVKNEGTGHAICAKTVNISQAVSGTPTTVTAKATAIFTLMDNAKFEVTGGTVSCSGSDHVILNSTGTVNVSGGKVENTGTGGAIDAKTVNISQTSSGTPTEVTSKGKTIDATVADATVTISGGAVSSSGTDTDAAAIYSTGTVTVSGGTVQATGTGGAIYAKTVKISEAFSDTPTTVTSKGKTIDAIEVGATVEVTGGIVSSTGTDGAKTIYSTPGDTVTISGGTVSSTGTGITTIVSGGTLTVTGGSIYGQGTAIHNGYTANISGGSIYCTGDGGGAIYNGGTLTVTGGNIYGSGTVINGNTLTISGGSIYSTGASNVVISASATNGTSTTPLAMYTLTLSGVLDHYTVGSILYGTPLADYGLNTTATTINKGDTAGSKLYVWLPNNLANGTPVSAMIGSTKYSGTIDKTAMTATLTAASATAITLDKTTLALSSNGTPKSGTLTATATPAGATVTWSSNNTAVATVANGVVTAVGNGTAIITATAGSVSATCTVTVTSTSTGGGGGSGSSSNNTTTGGIVITPASITQPTTQAEITVSGTVDGNGKATVNVSTQTIDNAITQAQAAAKKAGREADGVTLVLSVSTGGKTVNSVSVNLPKAVQEKIISEKIVNTVVLVDRPDVQVAMDLDAIREINRQAGADATVNAVATDTGKLTGQAKVLIGDRPLFAFTVGYGSGKTVSEFGSGSVAVALPYTLRSGETAAGVRLVYVDETGAATVVPGSGYDAALKAVTGVVPHFSLYGVGYDESAAWVNPFTDVAADAWYYDGVSYAVQSGLFAGTTTTTFAPQRNMTRATLWTVLARLDGQDVSGGATYYEKAQVWAKAEGISDGTNPNGAITRQQLAALLYRYDGGAAVTGDLSAFSDGATVSNYAKDAMVWAVENGILSGNNGKLLPHQNATRAQVAMMLYRLAQSAASAAQ